MIIRGEGRLDCAATQIKNLFENLFEYYYAVLLPCDPESVLGKWGGGGGMQSKGDFEKVQERKEKGVIFKETIRVNGLLILHEGFRNCQQSKYDFSLE